MRTLRSVCLLLTVLAATACDPLTSEQFRMDGTWVSANGNLRFTVQEKEGGEFTGGGTIEYAAGEPQPMELRGVRTSATVLFSLFDQEGDTLEFRGTFAQPGRIEGTLTGASRGSFAHTLLRE